MKKYTVNNNDVPELTQATKGNNETTKNRKRNIFKVQDSCVRLEHDTVDLRLTTSTIQFKVSAFNPAHIPGIGLQNNCY